MQDDHADDRRPAEEPPIDLSAEDLQPEDVQPLPQQLPPIRLERAELEAVDLRPADWVVLYEASPEERAQMRRFPTSADRATPFEPWSRPSPPELAQVPRRFGVGALMLLSVTFALLFGTMRSLDVPPVWFIGVGVLLTAVVLGQIVLFGGTRPRDASMLAGAIVLPMEVAAYMVFSAYFAGGASPRPAVFVFQFIAVTMVLCPLGAVAGYFAGVVAAGGFLVVDGLKDWIGGESAAADDEATQRDPWSDDDES